MSWPVQWPVGAQPAVSSVLGAAPAVINPAPAVAPPAGTQYTPEQWAQVQQQNWNQWAQWQQQYQQWHQQYGAEYQKSMSAMSAGQPGYPNVAVPPPLPVEASKPPLPQDDPPAAPFTPAVQGYSTAPQPAPYQPPQPQPQPPPPQPSRGPQIPPSVVQPQRDIPSLMSQQCEPPPLIGQNNRNNQNAPWQKRQNERQGNSRFSGGSGGLKRGMDQSPQDMFDTKRPNNRQDWQAQPQTTAPPPKSHKENLEELSEAEKKFDKQFADWEDQFNKWKEQNVDHPDKEQYRQYEKKWEQWRAQLLDRREQMKRKRLALMNEAKPPVPSISSIGNYAQPPPKFTAPGPQMLPKNDALEPYAKPPPNLNDEPLSFAQTNRLPMVIDMSEDTGDFLKPSTGGGIPGLDLVLEGGGKDVEEVADEFPEKQPQGPDFEAISKGINSILGDQKLLNMLSMVKQNQNIIADKPVPEFNEMSSHSHDDFSNQSGGGYHNQREFVANFDDQTRSSFTHNEFDSGPGRNQQQQQQQGRFERFEEGQFNPGLRRNDSFENKRTFGQGGQGQFGSNLERQISSNSDKPFGSDSFGPNSNRGPERQFGGPNSGGQFGGPNSEGQFGGPNSGGKFGGGPNSGGQFGGGPNSGGQFGAPNSGGKFGGPNSGGQFGGPNSGGPNSGGQFGAPNSGGKFGGPNSGGPNSGGQFGGPNSGGKFGGPNSGGQFSGPNSGGQYGGPHSGGQFSGPNSGKQFGGPNAAGQFGGPNSQFGKSNSGQFCRQGSSNNSDADNDRSFSGPNRFPPGPGRGPRNDEGFGDGDFEQRNPNDFGGPRNFRGGNDEQFGPRFGGPKGDRFDNDGPRFGPSPRDRFGGPPPVGARFENRQFGGPNHGEYEDEYGDQYDDQYGDEYNESYNEFNEADNFGAGDAEEFDESWKEPQDFQEPMEEPAGIKPNDENIPPPVEKEPEVLLQPATVIDYEHKSIKNPDVEVLVVPIHMFDYRHKPLSRIPYPQRPKWLAEVVRNIREFDPPLVRSYEPPRRYPRDPLPPPVETWRGRGGFNEYEDNHNRNRWSPPPPPIHDRRGGNRPSYEERKPYDDRKSFDEPKYKRGEKRTSRAIEDNFDNFDDFDDVDMEDLPEVELGKNDEFTGPDKFEEKTVFANPTNPNFNKPEDKIPPVKTATLIEDLISPPGRYKRPPRIVIILRGPPGSGKTFLAKLIKDKEVENGGSAPRILSLDDYFMVEQEREVIEDGKRVEIKEMVYEYEAEMEEMYRNSLVRSFKKTINDGYFPFIIVDNVNDKIKYFGEMWSYAKQNGFQVFICQLDLDVQLCTKRNIHNRTEAEIEACVKNWDPTPAHHPVLDATSLIQSGSIAEVEMEEVNSPESNGEEEDGSEDQVARSKWDNFDCSVLNLAKLDGVSKPLRPSSRTMEEYLQMESQWSPVKFTKPGQKRVRWADLEEQKEQERMRAIGFVVGQTNWDRMMDPSKGSSALTQTKFIERTRRF